MIDIRQGQVYWYDFGVAVGSAPADRHRCVVVQNETFNRSGISTTVVCGITSNLRRAGAPGNVRLNVGEAGLPKESVVNISQIMTVNKRELVECIGQLSPARVASICDGLHMLFDKVDDLAQRAD